MGKNNKLRKKDADYNKDIRKFNIGDLCTENMKIFGANNNLMRHLPFLVDGLKPGERRILYTMYNDVRAHHDSRFVKVEGISGQTMTFYHPHGKDPIYETLVKLAQPWNNIICLIEGKGNFGSPMGDKAGAARYIEARLSFYAYKCFFEEFTPNIVDMKSNYLGNKLEPEYLPSKYPNALINNTFGIGYGVSTGLPTYNFRDVVELTIKLLDDSDYEDVTLIPDSPTGAYIIDEGQFEEISETGKGKFKMRGVIEVDEENSILTIKSTPLQVSLNDVKEDILKLHKEGKIQGIRKFIDDCDETIIDYKILLKKEVDPVSIMHAIYTKTNMEKTVPVNFKLIDDYEDFDYNIRTLLLSWIDFRRETKRRLYNHKLIRAKERQHILETLLFILNKDNAEKTMTIVKKSENKAEIVEKLMKEYGISSLQADTIAEMKTYQFSKEYFKKYLKEKEEIDEKVVKYEKIVRSSKKIDAKIREELEEGIRLFGEDRKSKIISVDGEVKIRDTNHLVVFTLNGFVKKLSDKCTAIGFLNQNDYPIEITDVRNTTDLLIFDETGKISKLPVHLLQNSDLNSEGEKLNKFCSINGKITSILPKPTDDVLTDLRMPMYFLMVTKNGVMKKTAANQYSNIKNELLGLLVKEKDELKSVKILAGDKDVVVYTNKGFGVRISSTDIKETSRMSYGIKCIELGEGEHVIGMDIVNEKDKYLFCLTDKGNGKKSPMDTFQTMERNSKPLRITGLDDDEDVMIIKTVRGSEVFKAYLKNSVEQICVDDVMELPRLSKGRKLIPVRKGEVIIDVKESKK